MKNSRELDLGLENKTFMRGEVIDKYHFQFYFKENLEIAFAFDILYSEYSDLMTIRCRQIKRKVN